MKRHSLELLEIRKTFPGVRAVDGVTIQFIGGTIHALVGENGAGKSTLMKIAAGIYQPDGGSIVVDGKRYLSVIIVTRLGTVLAWCTKRFLYFQT